jgi:PST family polysaccharide transporter
MDMIARPIMILIMIAGVPFGVIWVAVGHGVAFFLYWLLAGVRCGQVTGVDVKPLFWTAWRTIALVSAPCGVLAWVASRLLHAAPVLELLAGVAAAGLWVLVAAVLFPVVRADLLVAVSIGRRALNRGGSAPSASTSPA